MDWTTALAIATAPIGGALLAWWLKRDKEREDREIAEWEAEQDAKAAKDQYALASIEPPPLLGFDGRSCGGTAGDSGGPNEAR